MVIEDDEDIHVTLRCFFSSRIRPKKPSFLDGLVFQRFPYSGYKHILCIRCHHNAFFFRAKNMEFFLNYQRKANNSQSVKERLLLIIRLFYSIGRIIDSINCISSSVNPYFLYSSSSVQGLLKSWRGTNWNLSFERLIDDMVCSNKKRANLVFK